MSALAAARGAAAPDAPLGGHCGSRFMTSPLRPGTASKLPVRKTLNPQSSTRRGSLRGGMPAMGARAIDTFTTPPRPGAGNTSLKAAGSPAPPGPSVVTPPGASLPCLFAASPSERPGTAKARSPSNLANRALGAIDPARPSPPPSAPGAPASGEEHRRFSIPGGSLLYGQTAGSPGQRHKPTGPPSTPGLVAPNRASLWNRRRAQTTTAASNTRGEQSVGTPANRRPEQPLAGSAARRDQLRGKSPAVEVPSSPLPGGKAYNRLRPPASPLASESPTAASPAAASPAAASPAALSPVHSADQAQNAKPAGDRELTSTATKSIKEAEKHLIEKLKGEAATSKGAKEDHGAGKKCADGAYDGGDSFVRAEDRRKARIEREIAELQEMYDLAKAGGFVRAPSFVPPRYAEELAELMAMYEEASKAGFVRAPSEATRRESADAN